MAKSIRLKNTYLVKDYAVMSIQSRVSMSNITAWAPTQIPFGSNTTIVTNNGDAFEQNGNYIKCKFKGTVLVFRELSMDYKGEIDIIDNFGWVTGIETHGNISVDVKTVNVNDNINFHFAGGMTEATLYHARIVVLRIA